RSAPARSRPAFWREGLSGEALRRPAAGDGGGGAHADPRRPTHDQPRAGSAPARAARSGAGCHRATSTVPGVPSTRGKRSREAPLWRAMRRLGWTQKKAPGSRAVRDGQARTAGRAAVATRAAAPLVLVDESGTHPSVTRLSGWGRWWCETL